MLSVVSCQLFFDCHWDRGHLGLLLPTLQSYLSTHPNISWTEQKQSIQELPLEKIHKDTMMINRGVAVSCVLFPKVAGHMQYPYFPGMEYLLPILLYYPQAFTQTYHRSNMWDTRIHYRYIIGFLFI